MRSIVYYICTMNVNVTSPAYVANFVQRATGAAVHVFLIKQLIIGAACHATWACICECLSLWISAATLTLL